MMMMMMMMIIITIIIIKAIRTIPEQHTGKAQNQGTTVTAIFSTAYILRKVLTQSTYETFIMKEHYK
jgi:hypothetical protein